MELDTTDTELEAGELTALLARPWRSRLRMGEHGCLTVFAPGDAPDAGRFEGAYGALFDAIASRPALTRFTFRLWGSDTAMHHFDQHVARALRACPAARPVLLDVPCGGAPLLTPLARLRFDGLVVGADLSMPMLSRAIRHHAGMTDAPRTAFLQCDALDLPLADGSVDIVISTNGLHCMPDIDRFLHELARVLRPGSHAWITTLVSTGSARHAAIMRTTELAGIIPGPAPTLQDLQVRALAAGFAAVELLGGDGIAAVRCTTPGAREHR